jgi:hypothetical protein
MRNPNPSPKDIEQFLEDDSTLYPNSPSILRERPSRIERLRRIKDVFVNRKRQSGEQSEEVVSEDEFVVMESDEESDDDGSMFYCVFHEQSFMNYGYLYFSFII